MSAKDIPIVFAPDNSCMSVEGFFFTDRAHVITDPITYHKIKKLLQEKGGLTDEPTGIIPSTPET